MRTSSTSGSGSPNTPIRADKRGDVLKKIERYPARPGCDQEQAFVYDGNFSIPVEQSTLIAAGRYVVQRDTLRSEADGKGKVPEWRKVYEKRDGAETLRRRSTTPMTRTSA